MGIRVDLEACNGCGTLEEPLCVRDCPGDLMVLAARDGKAFIRDNGECWDCAACVKVCPPQAITMQLASTIALPGVSLKGRALRSKTQWTVRLRDGTVRTYATPSRGKIPFTPSI